MKKLDVEKAGKISSEMIEKITELILNQAPEPGKFKLELVGGTIQALSVVLATLALRTVGKKKAVDLISAAIGNAMGHVIKHVDEMGMGWPEDTKKDKVSQ